MTKPAILYRASCTLLFFLTMKICGCQCKCVSFNESSDQYVKAKAQVSVNLTFLQHCPTRRVHPDFIETTFVQVSTHQNTSITVCQEHLIWTAISDQCSYNPIANRVSISRKVTDPKKEVWVIVGRFTNNESPNIEKRVEVFVNGTHDAEPSSPVTTTPSTPSSEATDTGANKGRADKGSMTYVAVGVAGFSVLAVFVTVVVACRIRKKMVVVKWRYSTDRDAKTRAMQNGANNATHETAPSVCFGTNEDIDLEDPLSFSTHPTSDAWGNRLPSSADCYVSDNRLGNRNMPLAVGNLPVACVQNLGFSHGPTVRYIRVCPPAAPIGLHTVGEPQPSQYQEPWDKSAASTLMNMLGVNIMDENCSRI